MESTGLNTNKKFFRGGVGNILMLGLFFVLYSCAHVRSGQYVRVSAKDNLSTTAKRYKVPEWELALANPDKTFQTGEWVFIPQHKGFLGSGRNHRSVAALPKTLGRPFMWPVPASKHVSSQYGKRRGRKHHGIDIPARHGTSILAVDDGVVVYSGTELNGYGNLTVVAHRYGLFSVYAHAEENLTQKGDTVHRGQVIAKIGSTGRSSGPHLHFEIRFRGQPIDPLRVVNL